MWLADEFAGQALGGIAAREIYRAAYKESDGNDFAYECLATDALRNAWTECTVVPERWTATQVRKLFENLEDVNYHSFLAKLIQLVELRGPKLARALGDWCKEVTP